MLADREATGDPDWYRPTYEGILQETPYTFREPEELTDPANWPASCEPNRGGRRGSLFLMNHWSPPTAPSEPDLERRRRSTRATCWSAERSNARISAGGCRR